MSQNSLHSYETHRLIQISLLIAIKAVICIGYRTVPKPMCFFLKILNYYKIPWPWKHSALLTNFYGCLKLQILRCMNAMHLAFTCSYVLYLLLFLAGNRHGSQNAYLQKNYHILEFVHCKIRTSKIVIQSHTF
jgi:hypothetical protein